MDLITYNWISLVLLALSLLIFIVQLFLMFKQIKMIDKQDRNIEKQMSDQENNAKSQAFFSLLSYLNTQNFFQNQRSTGALHQYVADMLEIVCKLFIDDQIDRALFKLILKEQVDREVEKFNEYKSVQPGAYTLKYIELYIKSSSR